MKSRGGALVTGAAKRLGRAMALALGQAGYDIAIHYRRSQAEAEALAAEISAVGARSCILEADLSREEEAARLIGEARALLGPLTLLVNSASCFETDDIKTMTRASWDAHIETNLRAPIKLAQDFAMQADDARDNLIVNILDQRVLKPTPQFLSYAISKAALYEATRMLAQGLAPKGIRVNAIGPGPTLRNARQSDEDWKRQNAATILGRGAEPSDIAAALLYLADARAVTGQMIAVDGGQHLAWKTADVLVKE
ncbi:MAG TPA: SDR family oxidoreductase [Parvularculaceae bacterium]|nr:SDR family oxidoreductase [Parvularculaceae bacterium]